MTAPNTPSRRPRAAHPQHMADRTPQIRQTIDRACNDESLAAILAQHGYDQDEFQNALALQQAVEQSFIACNVARGARIKAAIDLKEAEANARRTNADFRTVARAVLPKPTDRLALALTGNVPKDRQVFVLTARTSYNNARLEPHATTLATYGYPSETLDALDATLDALLAADNGHKAARADAIQATADRNAAFKALDAWAKQFTQIAQVALRDHPALLDRLDL